MKPQLAAAAPIRSLSIRPATVALDGSGTEQALLVTGRTVTGAETDLTAGAVYASGSAKVAQVSRDGLVRAAGSGSTWIEVRAGGKSLRVQVQVRNAGLVRPVSFVNDVVPVLQKAGCYQATCHAKQGGKAGFQLSVLAFDPQADYEAIVRQAGGRRIDRLSPGNSLFLKKPTMAMPHGGGQRFKPGSPAYALVARWIAEGASYQREGEPSLSGVEVAPADRTLSNSRQQRLLVTAVYSDGSRRDVTRLAQFRSNESAIADVTDDGIVKTSSLGGEAAVMARYLGQVAVARFTVPLNKGVPATAYAPLPRYNLIDDLVYRKLQQLNLLPSPECDDATFLRRASLDLIGTLPTAEETRAFLAECAIETGGSVEVRKDGSPEVGGSVEVRKDGSAGPTAPGDSLPAKATSALPHFHTSTPGPSKHAALKARANLVEKLLQRPEYADYWAMRWSGLLLVNPDLLTPRGAYAFDHWLREAFRQNMPYDRFAREILTASGDSYREGPPNFFRAVREPGDAGKAVSQLFLGVRMDCAQCHHHPFERWGQDDFYSLAAYFARVKDKGSYPEGYLSIIYPGDDGEVKHPKSGKVMPPRPLGVSTPQAIPEGEDRREALVQWMTSAENPYFARAIVNRVWALLMGRGLVEPVDDFRMSNPATNEPLLDALAKDFAAHGYDLKQLLRTIATSAAYGRSSVATPNNARDSRNYSHAYKRRMPAEVLLDAISQVTGATETFRGHPEGERAIQMWDVRLRVDFLDIFGRPGRQTVCECERSSDGSITQMLHLMSSGEMQKRLSFDKGAVARLDKSGKPPEEVVEELFLTAYSRMPSAEEKTAALTAFSRQGATRRQAIEDLLWVLLNSPEFLLNH